MIVATAGHVDHGKSLLVRTLTGVDPDRLPEEKSRGMTIDLGFAYLPVAGATPIGFVDVPGHERFVHNMLCGVGGIDFALLVVAADDGVMPQTREHLAILDLLGVARGAVALTKIDRVAPARVAEVAAQIRALLAGTTLAAAPILPVSAVAGDGVAALRDHLIAAGRALAPRAARGNFRLAVDRRFTVAGAGLVVTGTAVSGSIAVGETARLLLAGLPARVRGIHAQNAKADRGRAGERLALNLAGPDLAIDAIARGDWVVAGEVPPPVGKLDARLRLLAGEARPLAHWTPVHVHLGASDVTGRIAVLEGSSIAPGASGLVQLVLDRPIGAVRADRFIVRDQSARRTIGGGAVIDVYPPARGRRRPERLAVLAASENDDDGVALAALLDAAPRGLDLARFAANRNLAPAEAARLFESAEARTVATGAGLVGFLPAHWDALGQAAVEALAAWHLRSPDAVGPAADRVLSHLPGEVAAALVADLVARGAVVREGMGVRLASHRPSLAPADAALWAKVAPALDAGGLRPPALHEIAAQIGENPKKLESFLVRAHRHGLVVRLSENRFYRPAALRKLGEMAEQLAGASDRRLVAAAAFRDRSGIGRNLAIEVLEYFDRIKFTRRVGDAHQLVRRAAEVFGDSGAPSDV
jgi:selenocysteine-specific elongation factor